MKHIYEFEEFEKIEEYISKHTTETIADISVISIFVALYLKNKKNLLTSIIGILSYLSFGRDIVDEIYDWVNTLNLSKRAKEQAELVAKSIKEKEDAEETERKLNELQLILKYENGESEIDSQGQTIAKKIDLK